MRTRKRLVATAFRSEGVYNRAEKPSVTFCGKEARLRKGTAAFSSTRSIANPAPNAAVIKSCRADASGDMRGGFYTFRPLPPGNRWFQAEGAEMIPQRGITHSTEAVFPLNGNHAPRGRRVTPGGEYIKNDLDAKGFQPLQIQYIRRFCQNRVKSVNEMQHFFKIPFSAHNATQTCGNVDFYKIFCVFLKKVRFFPEKYGNI